MLVAAVALRAASGELAWSYTAGGVDTSPAVANGIVYVGGYYNLGGGRLIALNAGSGTLVWSSPNIGGVFSSPAVANGMVHVGEEKIYAFKPAA